MMPENIQGEPTRVQLNLTIGQAGLLRDGLSTQADRMSDAAASSWRCMKTASSNRRRLK